MTTIDYAIPVGIDNFRELTELSSGGKRRLFVDKSLLINEILDDDSKVILITRPRRFGKTINMSMLQHFLAPEVDELKTQGLFDNLLIAKNDKAMEHQGKYPVISVTFKNIKADIFKSFKSKFADEISEIFEKFEYVRNSLTAKQKRDFDEIVNLEASEEKLQKSLYNLTKFLHKYHKEKVYVLIDEYDTPIHQVCETGHYDDVVKFIKDTFGHCLKGNASLKQGVLTGITRIAKESIFSDLNNFTMHSLLDTQYSKHFGFTEEEIDYLFNKSSIEYDKKSIKEWYSGYLCGKTILYNPWSIMNCLKYFGQSKQYWVNTSGNKLIIDLIKAGKTEIYQKFIDLLNDKVIVENIDEHVVYSDIIQNRSAIWTLLLMTGYLKIISKKEVSGLTQCELSIPNKEVKYFYRNAIRSWFSTNNTPSWYQNFIKDLLDGNLLDFDKKLSKIVERVFSVRDIPNHKEEQINEPEAIYHAFMIGLLASLLETHEVTSNREAGLGYCDFIIIPNDLSQNGVVLEFKAPKDPKHLEKEAKEALQQIINKKYDMEFQNKGIQSFIFVGIAFTKKSVKIEYQIQKGLK